MGGSSQTTTVETAPLSAQGREWNTALTSLMLANLEDSGYSYNPKEVTEYSDPSRANTLQNTLSSLDQEIKSLQESLSSTPKQGVGDTREQQLKSALNRKKQAQNELDSMESYTYTDYQIEKLPDPRVQNAINQFGTDSPEVKQVEEAIFQESVFKSEQLAGIERTTLENITKYVNGDLSYTPEQKEQVNTLFGDVKSSILTLKNDLFKEYGETDAALREGLYKVAEEIDKTGFAIEDALKAAEIQIDKSGKNLFSVLEDVNKSTEARFKFQQDLLFEQVDTQVNQQNALLGLPPNSEAAQYQKAKMKQDVLTGLQLQLHEQELTGKMNIQGQMESGKQQISLSRVALAASQGEKKEGIAKDLLNVTAATAGKKESTLAATGEALLNLEQQKAAELKNLAYGNLPGMIGAGQGAEAFAKQMTGAQQGINTGAMSPFAQQLSVEQARSMAETTTTQEKSGGFLDAFTGLLGAGAAGAGAVMGGVGSMGMSSALNAVGQGTQMTQPTYSPWSNLSFGIKPF